MGLDYWGKKVNQIFRSGGSGFYFKYFAYINVLGLVRNESKTPSQ